MPELPEVETTRRGLAPWVEGAHIRSIKVRNASLRWPVPVTKLKQLSDQRIDCLERRSKYLLFRVGDLTLLMHLGMSGSMRVVTDDISVGKHDHIDIEIRNTDQLDKVVRFNDPRRFGCCLLLEGAITAHPLIASLGPEPLSDNFDADYLFKRSRQRRVAIKNFIMDAKVVVGVGNIYASEALHLARISPGIAAGRISRQRIAQLVQAIREVLQKAIDAGGTTLNDFTQADGQPGYFRHELQVYGRAGEACFSCGAPIKSRTLGQRNTFYCSACQN